MRYYINGVEATPADMQMLYEDGAIIRWCFVTSNCWYIITNN